MHQCMHAGIRSRNTLAHAPPASSEQQHTQRLASRPVQRQKQSGRPRSQDPQTTRCSARWPSRCVPRRTPSSRRACRTRKKGARRAPRVRAVDRDTRALQEKEKRACSLRRSGSWWGMGVGARTSYHYLALDFELGIVTRVLEEEVDVADHGERFDIFVR
jgi:hypothetical protein